MEHLITYREERMIWIDGALVKALVAKLGGKTTISQEDARPYAWGTQMELRVSTDDASAVHVELIDPSAPVEGAHYWVKVLGGISPEWKVARYAGDRFWVVGSPSGYLPVHIFVGDRIPTPEQPAKAADPQAAPDGYVSLDEGVRCRCIRLRRDSAGTYWCCGGGRAADKTAAENSSRI